MVLGVTFIFAVVVVVWRRYMRKQRVEDTVKFVGEKERSRMMQLKEERSRMRQLKEEKLRMRQLKEEKSRMRQSKEERTRIMQLKERWMKALNSDKYHSGGLDMADRNSDRSSYRSRSISRYSDSVYSRSAHSRERDKGWQDSDLPQEPGTYLIRNSV